MASGTHVFLSHNWGEDDSGRDNHYRVSLINKELKKLGYQTWFDADRMTGDIVKQMSQGIEQTEGVLVFITRRYLEKVTGENSSDNCKLEFEYATRNKTNSKMIAVVMEKCMSNSHEWTGAVGMHLGGRIYVDMTGDLVDKAYLSKQMEVLQREIQSIGIQLLPGILYSDFSLNYYGGNIHTFYYR